MRVCKAYYVRAQLRSRLELLQCQVAQCYFPGCLGLILYTKLISRFLVSEEGEEDNEEEGPLSTDYRQGYGQDTVCTLGTEVRDQ